jgi:hypothetical protein
MLCRLTFPFGRDGLVVRGGEIIEVLTVAAMVVVIDEELFRRHDHEEGKIDDEIIGFGQAKDRSLRGKIRLLAGQAQRHRRWTARVSRVMRFQT